MDYKVNVNFPDIRNALYAGSGFSEIRKLYIEELRKSNSIYNILYANKLDECKNMLSTQNLNELEEEFHDFKEHMRKWAKKHHVSLILMRRQKDFLGLNEKIRLFLKTGQPLDKIWDLLGFRIVLGTSKKETPENIHLCYEVLNELIRFFAFDRFCTFLEAEPPVNTGESFDGMDIYIPSKSEVLEGFENNIKDYIISPKTNGYQSLHMIIRKPNGLTFEVQIRTYAMDLHAEHGGANHDGHKRTRYEDNSDYNNDIQEIDFTKINIPGFYALEDEKTHSLVIHDLVGLTKSIDPFNFLV